MALRERKQWNRIIQGIIVIIFLWIVFQIAGYLVAESLWFIELGYLPSFIKRILWEVGLGLGIFIISLSFLLGNILIAEKYKWHFPQKVIQKQSSKGKIQKIEQVEKIPQTGKIRLRILIPIVLFLVIIQGLMLLYYSDIAWLIWQPDFRLPNVIPTSPFEIKSIQEIWLQILQENLWKLGIVGVVGIFILAKNQWGVKAIALGMSIVVGILISGNWEVFLEYFNATEFKITDPQYGIDIGFYVFKLPIWQLLNFWWNGICLLALSSVTLIYLLSGNSISEGKFPGFSRRQLRHLYALGGCQMIGLAVSHWLGIYEILYSTTGVNYGASFTDVKIQLPREIILLIFAEISAIWLFWKSGTIKERKEINITKKITVTRAVLSGYLLLSILGYGARIGVQMLIVQPNELSLEKPYIERTIALTRAAFGLEDIEVETFNPQGMLNPDIIQENQLTIDNIRLWDTRPILQTNRQLQQIRPYYKFPDADIDRYTLQVAKEGEITVEKRQVIISPRELNYNDVPERAQTWVNKHLVYTHGYGFTLSPVNQVGEGGLPFYYVKDIGTDTDAGELRTSSDTIRDSIPIGKPRIYYGKLTDTYIMTSTKLQEFDFPSGDENVYNTYDGTGGIEIGSLWKRLLFSVYLKDWKMLFTQNFTPETKVLFRRDIESRIQAIAPFLHFDRYPYLVAANADQGTSKNNNYLYWIVDAYTISDRYPYSDPGEQGFNYIRNSVKIVIDAYNGKVDFYVANPDDPIIKTWTKIFPGLFKPLNSMPITLFTHIRYPVDLFSTQSERLLTYHMTDPQVFYNREDQWEIPVEIYGNQAQPIEPYYLIMKLPKDEKKIENSEEFILLIPYTPNSRPNLIAWLAARSDGAEYGKLLLYQFPKQKLVFGPDQIEALINQDPVISQQISLWNRQGSRAVQGNLLVIPIEGESLLYVEPVYLEAEENSLPTLVRVIVVYENRIVMAENLDKALQAIFEPESATTEPPIIRPLEEPNIIIPNEPINEPNINNEQTLENE